MACFDLRQHRETTQWSGESDWRSLPTRSSAGLALSQAWRCPVANTANITLTYLSSGRSHASCQNGRGRKQNGEHHSLGFFWVCSLRNRLVSDTERNGTIIQTYSFFRWTNSLHHISKHPQDTDILVYLHRKNSAERLTANLAGLLHYKCLHSNSIIRRLSARLSATQCLYNTGKHSYVQFTSR